MKDFVWTDRVKYEVALQEVKEKSSILSTIKRKKATMAYLGRGVGWFKPPTPEIPRF
jgi:hypothetical protein